MTNSSHDFMIEKKTRLDELFQELERTKEISIKDLAFKVRQIGFHCLRCGDCCVGNDTSVIVFPSEISDITNVTGDCWLETAEPPIEGEWDREGNFHTLEWRLKKKNSSCNYFTSQGCMIYKVRPLLCRTYPFYLDRNILGFSECQGLGEKIGIEESESLAMLLVERTIKEIEEAIALIEKFDDFERGPPSSKGTCIVHDSRGEHKIEWNFLMDFEND
jgi:Fe-S-cluster containining protein